MFVHYGPFSDHQAISRTSIFVHDYVYCATQAVVKSKLVYD